MTLDDFRKIAEAATPGPWESHPLPVPVGISNATLHAEAGAGERWTNDFPPEIGSMATIEDAVFAATFDPERVLELLDQIEQLQAVVRDSHDNCTYQTRLAAVEELHVPQPGLGPAYCTECDQLHPCDTTEVVRGE